MDHAKYPTEARYFYVLFAQKLAMFVISECRATSFVAARAFKPTSSRSLSNQLVK